MTETSTRFGQPGGTKQRRSAAGTAAEAAKGRLSTVLERLRDTEQTSANVLIGELEAAEEYFGVAAGAQLLEDLGSASQMLHFSHRTFEVHWLLSGVLEMNDAIAELAVALLSELCDELQVALLASEQSGVVD